MNCLPSKPELKRLGYGRERPLLEDKNGERIKMAKNWGPFSFQLATRRLLSRALDLRAVPVETR